MQTSKTDSGRNSRSDTIIVKGRKKKEEEKNEKHIRLGHAGIVNFRLIYLYQIERKTFMKKREWKETIVLLFFYFFL